VLGDHLDLAIERNYVASVALAKSSPE